MPPNPEIPPGKVIARVAAGAMLTMSAGRTSASFDKFASWFLAAFGAGLALIVSHLKEVAVFVPLPTVASVAYFFLAAAAVCVAQKYLAMVVSIGAESAKEAREMGDKLPHMDSDEFLVQVLRGMPWPVRKICQGMFDALKNGDYAVSGRLFMRLAILHGVLVGIELIILLVALAKIVNKINA